MTTRWVFELPVLVHWGNCVPGDMVPIKAAEPYAAWLEERLHEYQTTPAPTYEQLCAIHGGRPFGRVTTRSHADVTMTDETEAMQFRLTFPELEYRVEK